MDSGTLTKRKPSAHKVGILGRTNTPRQCVGGTAHAGVGVRGLDEIANFDEFFPCDLVANPGRHTINGGIIPHARVFLKGNLQIPERLHLVHERDEFRIVVCVEQVVFKHRKLSGIWQGVSLAVFFLQERVHLGRGEFMRITALNLSDDRVTGLNTALRVDPPNSAR